VDMLLFIAALARIFSVCIIKCLPWPYFLSRRIFKQSWRLFPIWTVFYSVKMYVRF